METTITCKTPFHLQETANSLLNFCKKDRFFAFYGAMGVGKTALIKAICKELGVKETVTSPTFSLVNEYQARDVLIYHFDFYRITELSEVYDIGYEEYFYSNNYCFVEWSEKIETLLPENYVEVQISQLLDSGNQRNIHIKKHRNERI